MHIVQFLNFKLAQWQFDAMQYKYHVACSNIGEKAYLVQHNTSTITTTQGALEQGKWNELSAVICIMPKICHGNVFTNIQEIFVIMFENICIHKVQCIL